jgi:hypothetical protein
LSVAGHRRAAPANALLHGGRSRAAFPGRAGPLPFRAKTYERSSSLLTLAFLSDRRTDPRKSNN